MTKTAQRSMAGWLVLAGAGVLLSACGNGPAWQSGVFLDAAVEGLDYESSAGRSSTSAQGEFRCESGEAVSFSVGALAMGRAACGSSITPLTLAGGSDVKADAVVNRLLALQSLDEDRDPANGDGPTAPVPGSGATGSSKVFPAPSFAPSVGIVRIGKGGATLASSLPLKLDAGRRITGLPPQSGVGATGETPLTDRYVFDPAKANFDASGLDPESLVYDRSRKVLWTSDEYGPFIARINLESGVIEKKYAPGPGAGDLPAVLAQRRPNRGMEGLTLDTASGTLHGFLQSPIDPRDAAGKSIKARPPGGSSTDVRHIARFTRWLAFDPASETSRLYAYPLDGSQYDKDRTGNAKLGDVVSLGQGRFIVIEQGAREGDAKVVNKLMLVELPANATDIKAWDQRLEISSITLAPEGGADYAAVVPMKKTELLDLNALGWLAEKAEGLTIVDDQTLALVNDNDFGLGSVLLGAHGAAVAGSVEDCKADAAGVLSGCPSGAVAARLTRGTDLERPARIWLIKLDRKLSELRLPS